MNFRERYAFSRTDMDRWPIMFQPHCERTACNWLGESETLLEVIERLDAGGYDLIERAELENRLKKAKNGNL